MGWRLSIHTVVIPSNIFYMYMQILNQTRSIVHLLKILVHKLNNFIKQKVFRIIFLPLKTPLPKSKTENELKEHFLGHPVLCCNLSISYNIVSLFKDCPILVEIILKNENFSISYLCYFSCLCYRLEFLINYNFSQN